MGTYNLIENQQMPFDLANGIFELVKMFYIYKDFYWRNGSKANAQSGYQAKKTLLSTPQKSDAWKKEKMISLEAESREQQNQVEHMMKKMFKSWQIRYVKSDTHVVLFIVNAIQFQL